MACDKETLMLISAYADGEATSVEASRADAHLERCAECRARMEEWSGQRQMVEWAYTADLPVECDIEELIGRESAMPRVSRIPRLPSLIWPHHKWVRAGAVLAAVLLIFAVYYAFVLPPVLSVGEKVSPVKHVRSARIEGGIRLRVGPDSVISRLDDRSIRLEKGWVDASVRHGSGLRVLTKRMEVLDQGTCFEVGTGPKLDYVLVEEGSVSVLSGKTEYRLGAGRVLVAGDHGRPSIADLPKPDSMPVSEGKRIGEGDATFMPSSGQELDWDRALRKLARRFPDVRLSGSSGGGTTLPETGLECGSWRADAAGVERGLREHFSDVAKIVAGGKIDSKGWDVPMGVIQFYGETVDPGVSNDIYLVRLVPRGDTIVWRLNGSEGGEIDFPFALEEYDEKMWGNPDHAVEWMGYSRMEHGEYITSEKLKLACWPGRLKPTLVLSVKPAPPMGNRKHETDALAKAVKRIPIVKGFGLEHGESDLLYLDTQRKHWLLIVWGKEAGRELCSLSDSARRGQGGAAVIGAIATDMPLEQPQADAGVYLIRLVLQDSTAAPYLELARPDMRPLPGLSRLPSALEAAVRKVEACGETGWYPESLPGYGTMELSYIRMSEDGDAFPLGLKVKGRPDDRSTREIKKKEAGGSVSTHRGTPEKVWAEGLIRIRKPR